MEKQTQINPHHKVSKTALHQDHDILGLQKCGILHKDEIVSSAKSIADHYLKTNRLKQWNPSQSDRKSTDPKYEYCYMNFDINNNLKDYTITKDNCSISNIDFNYPFIKDIFQDNNYESAYKSPFNKCVFKIDKSRITNEDLQNFWHNIGSNECLHVNKLIYEVYDKAVLNLKQCEESFKVYSESNVFLKNRIHEYSNLIKHANNLISECESDRKKVKCDIVTTKTKRDSVLRSIQSHELDCKQNEVMYTNNFIICSSNINFLHIDYNNILKSNSELQTKVNAMQYSNAELEKQNDYYKKEIDTLSFKILDMQNMYTESNKMKASMQTQRDNCLTMLSNCFYVQYFNARSQEQIAVDNFNNCCSNCLWCATESNTQHTLCNVLLNDINKYTKEIKELQENISIYKRNNATLYEQNSNLDKLIEIEWERLRKICKYTEGDIQRFTLYQASLSNVYNTRYNQNKNANNVFNETQVKITSQHGSDLSNCYETADPTPINCKVSSWSQWSPCTTTCGIGTQRRSRTKTKEAKNGGSCPPLNESRTCINTSSCRVDCAVSGWGDWGWCSNHQGKGTKLRTRKIIRQPANGGARCPSLYESTECFDVSQFWIQLFRDNNFSGNSRMYYGGDMAIQTFSGRKSATIKVPFGVSSYKISSYSADVIFQYGKKHTWFKGDQSKLGNIVVDNIIILFN